MFCSLLLFCFIIVTVRVTVKFIHLERFRLSGDEDLWSFLFTDKSDNRTDVVDRSTDSLESEAVELFAQLSMFQFLPSDTQLVEEHLLCLSLSRFEQFSVSLVCIVLPILSYGDFRLFWNTFCWQLGHKFSSSEWHSSLRNRVVRRRMCLTGFPLCYPFK